MKKLSADEIVEMQTNMFRKTPLTLTQIKDSWKDIVDIQEKPRHDDGD